MALNANMTDKYGIEDTLDEKQWAKLAPLLGTPYSVRGTTDLACTPVAGTLSTSIAAGRAQCYGFGADFKAQTVTHPALAAGASRYDLVAMRFDWSLDAANGGGNAYPIVLTGGATPVLPSSRMANPGVIYDMPLALAHIKGGTVPVYQYFDLRHFPAPLSTKYGVSIAPEDLTDGQVIMSGGGSAYYRASTKSWVTPSTQYFTDTITPYTSTTVAKNPQSGRLLAQLIIPDPGFTYSIVLSGQLELDPITRTEVWAQYAAASGAATWTPLRSQFFTQRGTAETKTLTTHFVKARTGQTVINLLAQVADIDYKTGATYSVSAYNGFFEALVIPL